MSAPSPLDDSPRLRIILAPSAYYPHVGGIEEVTRHLALELQARGHRVDVLTNRWPTPLAAREQLAGVGVERLAFPLPASTPRGIGRFLATGGFAAGSLIRAVSRQQPDVLHVIGGGPQAAYVAALRPLLRAHLVFTGQGELSFDATGVFARSVSLRLGLRLMLRRADCVTACSAFVLRDLQAFARIAGPALVIPNGVDPSELASPRSVASPAYVLAVGRLVPQKGFDVLLRAAADERMRDVRIVVAGDGPDRSELECLAGELGIAHRVDFVGEAGRGRVAELLGGAAAFAFPSRGEGFGIALLEAMAAGVPAVATTAGGIPEFARDGRNALLVPADDASALAAAIARLLRDGDLACDLAEHARETAAQLAWGHVAGRYEELYRGLVA